MAEQIAYIRQYSLVIGEIKELISNPQLQDITDYSNIYDVVTGGKLQKNSDQGGYRDYVTLPDNEDVIEINELQIQVKVEYAGSGKSSPSASKTTLKIYNLSKNSLKSIKTDNSVILKAGYSQDKELPLIFAGQISSVKTTKEGANTITTILCADSFTPRKNLRVSRNFPKDTTYKEIVQYHLDQAADYGVPTGKFFIPDPSLQTGLIAGAKAIVTTSKYNAAKKAPEERVAEKISRGFSAFGLLFESLQNICDNIGYRSYLSQGSLYVEPNEFRINQTEVDITSDNIIGSIKLEDENTGKLSSAKLNTSGITLRIPLNGSITGACIVNLSDIENEDLSGSFNVSSYKHLLDFEGKDWVTELSCKRIS